MATKKTPTTPKKRAEAEGRKKMLARKAEARAARVKKASPDAEPPPVATSKKAPIRPVKGGSAARGEEPKVEPKASQEDDQAPARGQFRGMTVEELRDLYTAELGRPTESDDRTYLEWKIRMARAGKVRIGPRKPREGMPKPKLIPIRLEVDELEAIDAAWKAAGMHTRMQFILNSFTCGLRSMLRKAPREEVKEAISKALDLLED